MKTLKFPMAIMLGIMGMFIFNSCNTEDSVQAPGKTRTAKKVINGTGISYCGTQTVVHLIAGNPKNVINVIGNVTVGNDAENLYVTYETKGGWEIDETHLYVGNCDSVPTTKKGNAIPGQFPETNIIYTSAIKIVYSIPLETLPECFCVAAHAAVVKEGCEGQTAWGEGVLIVGEEENGSWGMKFNVCKEECEEECFDYTEETAWAAGKRYVDKGNWATYTTYEAGKTVNLIAGQDINNPAGTVTFTTIGEKIIIKIKLENIWLLQDVNEPIKIQGYNAEPPKVNPAPGQFTTYKGKANYIEADEAWVVEVPKFNYYGIHVDVLMKTPCDVVK